MIIVCYTVDLFRRNPSDLYMIICNNIQFMLQSTLAIGMNPYLHGIIMEMRLAS